MKKIILTGLCLFFATPCFASVDVDALISRYSAKYDLSDTLKHQMIETMQCESNFQPDAIGDSGHSLGLSQIYLIAHPEVTKEEAFDPDFSVNFMAKNFAANNMKIWTCWRQLF